MIGQPLATHRAEVAQEVPRITAAPTAVSKERTADNDECEEDGQRNGTKHGST
jgi:hypothetical protein